MMKTHTMTGRNWSEFIAENETEEDAQAVMMVATVKAALSAYRATVAQQYAHLAPRNFDADIDRAVGVKTFSVTFAMVS